VHKQEAYQYFHIESTVYYSAGFLTNQLVHSRLKFLELAWRSREHVPIECRHTFGQEAVKNRSNDRSIVPDKSIGIGKRGAE